MVHTQRLLTAALAAALLTATAAFGAQPLPPAALPEQIEPEQRPSTDEALDAELFYEILLGEITFRAGDPGSGFALMLITIIRKRVVILIILQNFSILASNALIFRFFIIHLYRF